MTFDDHESDELDQFAQNMNMRFSRKALNATRARIRNAIQRESQASDKRNAEMASYMLNQINKEEMTKGCDYTRRSREQHAVVVGISRLTSSVLRSVDVNAPIIVEKSVQSQLATAKTDFDSIVIGVKPGIYNENDRDGISALIHLIKGLVYHEGGHIKYTTPFNSLVAMSELDIPAGDRFSLVQAWNILEDQRMETAMCVLSPVLAKYFTSIVLNVVVNKHDLPSNWPWLAGRTYLPSAIRELFRESANLHTQQHLIPEINECVMTYRKSTDAAEMVRCVVRFAGLLSKWGAGGRNADTHTTMGMYGKKDGVPQPQEIPQSDKDDEEVQQYSGSDVTPRGDTDDEEDNEVEHGTQHTDETSGRGAPGKKSEEPESMEDTRRKEEELERLRAQTENALKEELAKNSKSTDDHEIDEFIASVNEIINSSVLPDRTTSPMNEAEIIASKEVAGSMLSVLERLFVQVEPTWSLYQEDGIIDPTSYITREPGDINFWSGLDGSGGSGHDIAVSVLLDSSGSMQSHMSRVSIAAMGIRHACDQLGIPCTITTFNDDVYMVAAANEDVGFVRVSAEGGTSVFNAMMAIEEQKFGRTYHLVMILTDGEWFDVSDVRLWSQPQRHIVIAGFGWGLEKCISDKSADHWVVIDNPLELPNLVTDSLVKQFT